MPAPNATEVTAPSVASERISQTGSPVSGSHSRTVPIAAGGSEQQAPLRVRRRTPPKSPPPVWPVRGSATGLAGKRVP